jgi:hypothetical protein
MFGNYTTLLYPKVQMLSFQVMVFARKNTAKDSLAEKLMERYTYPCKFLKTLSVVFAIFYFITFVSVALFVIFLETVLINSNHIGIKIVRLPHLPGLMKINPGFEMKLFNPNGGILLINL